MHRRARARIVVTVMSIGANVSDLGTVKQTGAEPIRVVLVDSHELVLWGLAKLIDGEWPRMMVVGTARTLVDGDKLLQERNPDVVVVDADLAAGRDGTGAAILADGGAGVCVMAVAGGRGASGRREAGATRRVVPKDAPGDVLLHEIEMVHGAGDRDREQGEIKV
jgi:two-component system, NarL family, nitrate/nitrite response regulator NarL